MPVEAHHHLLHTGGQKAAATHAGWEGGGGCSDVPGRHACFYAGMDVTAWRQGQEIQQSSSLGPAAAPALVSGQMMMTATGWHVGQVCVPDSGVMIGGMQEVMVAPCRKRKRAAEQSQALELAATQLQQQQLVDADRPVLQHTTNMWVKMTEATAEIRLRAKDEEIMQIGQLNWALQDRVKSLIVEVQVWRELAQSNEAAANALRIELQCVLDAQQECRVVAAGGGADDAVSCCCGENDDVGTGEEEVGTTERRTRRFVM